MTRPEQSVIDEIDALIDWEMHGGEAAATWRAQNGYPLDENNDCLCPACKPDHAMPASPRNYSATATSRTLHLDATLRDVQDQPAITPQVHMLELTLCNVAPGYYDRLELRDGIRVPISPVTISGAGSVVFVTLTYRISG